MELAVLDLRWEAMRGHETPLQMARRHVRDGEERLARQDALVRKMGAAITPVASLARELLDVMSATLVIARGDLERLERKARHDPWP